MYNQEKSNLQIALDSEPKIKMWLEELILKGRRYNLSVTVIGDKLLHITKGSITDSINLDIDIEQLKLELHSLMKKYTLT